MHRNRRSLGIVLIAFLAPLLSGFLSYRTGHGHWFARSGSITVLLAAVVQFQLALQLEASQYRALVYGVLVGLPRQASQTPLSRFLARASLYLIIAGTFI